MFHSEIKLNKQSKQTYKQRHTKKMGYALLNVYKCNGKKKQEKTNQPNKQTKQNKQKTKEKKTTTKP